MERCVALGGASGPMVWLNAGCAPSEPSPAPVRRATPVEIGDDDDDSVPRYVRLHRRGQLKERGDALWKRMSPCKLCPRTCGVDRPAGEKGFCQAGASLVIALHHPHFGEESPLVGKRGSGTVLFSHCGLRCVFCIERRTCQPQTRRLLLFYVR